MTNNISIGFLLLNSSVTEQDYISLLSKKNYGNKSFFEELNKYTPKSSKVIESKKVTKNKHNKESEIKGNTENTARSKLENKYSHKDFESLSENSHKTDSKDKIDSTSSVEENNPEVEKGDFAENKNAIEDLEKLHAYILNLITKYKGSDDYNSLYGKIQSNPTPNTKALELEPLLVKIDEAILLAKDTKFKADNLDLIEAILSQVKVLTDIKLNTDVSQQTALNDISVLMKNIVDKPNEDSSTNFMNHEDSEVLSNNHLNNISSSAAGNQIKENSLDKIVITQEGKGSAFRDTGREGEDSTFKIIEQDNTVELTNGQEDFNRLISQTNVKVELRGTDITSYFDVNKNSLQQLKLEEDNILSQIIDNAKINISKGESEIKIKLKPEILGEMSLKVILEEGIVKAKISVENQQVKQLIESNLSLLKDNLRAQGLEVHSFEVFTGSDPNPHHQQRKQWSNEPIKKKGKLNVTLDELNQIYEDYSIDKKYGYYSQNTGIDFMA